MGVRTGLEAVAYINYGSILVPDWVAVDSIKNLTINFTKGKADASTRGAAGFRQSVGTLKDLDPEFDIVQDTSKPEYAVFKDSWINGTVVDIALMDGDITVSGTQGVRLQVEVFEFTDKQDLEDVLRVDVKTSNAYGSIPEFMTI